MILCASVLLGIFLFVLVAPPVGAGSNIKKVNFITYTDGSTEVQSDEPEMAAALSSGSKPVCYTFLGVNKTKTPIKYYINTRHSGLSSSFVKSAMINASKKWDAATSKTLFYGPTMSSSPPILVQDGKNVVSFENKGANGVLASTSLYIDGDTYKIIEWDMIFNSYYKWGNAAKNKNIFDFQSTATHEFGHILGLGEVTDSENCYSTTMYIGSKKGQTFRRSLEPADITGLRKIYGK
jgi:hypothetical protein